MLGQRQLGRTAPSASRRQKGWLGIPSRSRAAAGLWSSSAAPSTGSTGTSRVSDPSADLGTWTPEYIRQRVQEQEAEDEAMRAADLVRPFQEDPEGLYKYVDRAYEDAQVMEELAGDLQMPSYPAAAANDIIGMGSWRLKSQVDPVIEFMVTRIEGCWREIMDEDLCLYPRDKWKTIGWDLADSEDPKRELDGFSWGDIPDPEKGAEGYPRLLLENRVYCSRVFRKLHVEVGIRQDGMQVLHVVIYPRYNYDMPIFGLDLVLVNGRVTLAVVDCCPVRQHLKLPPQYMETMALLQRTFLEGQDPTARRIPEWGAAIFSPLALCITPTTPEELAAFTKYAVALHRAYLSLSLNAVPVIAVPGDKRAASKLQELLDGQKRFCDNQLVNKKTRRVLEAAFGKEWADDYMSKLMFDFDPSYEPPYFDESLDRLYQFLDDSITPKGMAAYNQELEMATEASRVNELLDSAAAGRPVSREKLTLAMQFLYESDPTFRAAVETLTGGTEVPSEDLLTNEFLQLITSSGGVEEQQGSA